MIFILDKILDGIVLLILSILFFLGVYTVSDTLYVYSGASFHGTNIYKPGDHASGYELRELSEDVIAWITLDDTGVDYPVMQGRTNSQYLNTDPYGEYSVGGSIFLDVRNDPLFEDSYNMIYGHHMEAGAMFGALDAYANRSFFDTHAKGTLTLVNHTEYELSVFAYGTGNVADQELFDLEGEEEMAQRYEWIRTHANYFREPNSMHWIALTTCKETSGTDRTFVICSLLEQEDRMNNTGK